MNLINKIDNITDWNYDAQIFLFLKNIISEQNISVYRISHQFANPEYIESIKLNNEPYILFIKGNENHLSFDYLYDDPNLLGIIKNYPSIKNMSNQDGEQSYKCELFDGRPFYPIEMEDERTLNIPLGVCNGFVSYGRRVRNIDRFFWGQQTTNRTEWLSFCNSIKEYSDKDVIGLYKGFGGVEDENLHTNALTREEYSRTMGNSDFAFCPAGQSPETYRISEAAASGCVILGDGLPATEYYLELPYYIISPSIFNKPKDEIIPVLQDRLNQIMSAKSEYSFATLDWYNRWAEPTAVARTISKYLRRINVT